MESDESKLPSISPMLKLTPNAGPASVEARLTAKGNLARRQNGFADVIDATPCAFIFMAVGASRNDSGGQIHDAWVSTRVGQPM
jgi:hypothetical protein